jgi:hypothetical protein
MERLCEHAMPAMLLLLLLLLLVLGLRVEYFLSGSDYVRLWSCSP